MYKFVFSFLCYYIFLGDVGCLFVYFSFEYVYDYIVYDELYNGNVGIMYGCVCIVSNGKFGKGL